MAPRSDSAYLKAFGNAVRDHRSRIGLSQEELSFKSDLDRTYISGVERGVRNPTIKTVRRIAAALGTAPSVLLAAADGGRADRRGSSPE